MSRVQTIEVDADEADMRLDRWFKAHFPGVGHGQLEKLLRKGEVRVDGKRAKAATRLEVDQTIRVPPLPDSAGRAPVTPGGHSDDAQFLNSITLFEDDKVLVLNKPIGLAVQGGSGTTRHVDGLLEALRDRKGQKPRLVHRLDKDTSGVLVVAKTRAAASAMAKSFRARATRKIYWALLKGVPKPRQGRISTYLRKVTGPDGDIMEVAAHGDRGADHAVTHYSVVEDSGGRFAWMTFKPVTGRTHQLRIHAQSLGHPIIGDGKYFNIENWDLPAGFQNRLHLLARRIVIPHPDGGSVDVTAPLPPHMVQSWNMLGFDVSAYDPAEEEAP